MLLDSAEVPQADVMPEVIKTVEAVNSGAKSFQEICAAIGMVERQGRYYRLAAQKLGLISNTRNNATITSLGKQLLETDELGCRSFLTNIVFQSPLFQRLVPYLENNRSGLHEEEITEFIKQITKPMSKVTLNRRISSVIGWLKWLGILEVDNNVIRLSNSAPQKLPGIIEIQDDIEPLLPKTFELDEYKVVKERVLAAESELTTIRNLESVERASNAHIRLVNLLASRLRNANCIPRTNRFVDLATRHLQKPYIFEVKSINNNARSQIRAGLSQLYEYRYLQNLPEAGLVLFIETQPPASLSWMIDYLENDRNVHVVWDGNDQLFAKPKTQTDLSFLWTS